MHQGLPFDFEAIVDHDPLLALETCHLGSARYGVATLRPSLTFLLFLIQAHHKTGQLLPGWRRSWQAQQVYNRESRRQANQRIEVEGDLRIKTYADTKANPRIPPQKAPTAVALLVRMPSRKTPSIGPPR